MNERSGFTTNNGFHLSRMQIRHWANNVSAKINGNDCSGDYSLRFQSQSFRTDPTDRQTKVATTKICFATTCEYVEGH